MMDQITSVAFFYVLKHVKRLSSFVTDNHTLITFREELKASEA